MCRWHAVDVGGGSGVGGGSSVYVLYFIVSKKTAILITQRYASRQAHLLCDQNEPLAAVLVMTS